MILSRSSLIRALLIHRCTEIALYLSRGVECSAAIDDVADVHAALSGGGAAN